MQSLNLFALIGIAVAIVGAYLWLKPRKGAKGSSGIGDQGQIKKH